MAIDRFNANFPSAKAKIAELRKAKAEEAAATEENRNKQKDPVIPTPPSADDFTLENAGAQLISEPPVDPAESDDLTLENAGAQLIADQNKANLTQPTIEIQSGDTLTKISKETGVSIDDILAENREITDRNLISAGAKLKLPNGAKRTTAATTPNPFRPLNTNPTDDPVIDSPASYQIKPGDNLTKLAKEWGVNIADIAEANRGTVSDPNKINAGKYLVVPIERQIETQVDDSFLRGA